MAKFNVNGNLMHDNRAYGPGDAIELTEEQAAPHLKSGIVILPEDHDARVQAAEAERQVAEHRERAGIPRADDPAPEAEPAKPAEEGKPIVDDTVEDEDAKGADGEETRPDENLSNAPTGDDL